ncbi:hypothetical protein WJX74_003752 [Apatococcus lobatus]|uniref:Chlorophyll a-b binding protein, chloroplastic n=2 Tax=Apatococcus TaxID=904362 RepID=A0AAW1T0E4_9CHLO
MSALIQGSFAPCAASQRLRETSLSGSNVRVAPASRAQVIRKGVSCKAAADRQLWYPGIQKVPDYLDGSLPGDYGFDPLRLGSDGELLRWFVQAELVHGRTAMIGVAGILLPGIATKLGFLNLPSWYDAGKIWIENNKYFPFWSLLFTQLILTGWVEAKRWADYKNPGSQGDGSFFGLTDDFVAKENGYPGGIFDPFNLAEGPLYEEYKVKEIKNGRLAMIAFLGFSAQFAATGKDPLDNLFDHLADPTHNTVATNGVSFPFLGAFTPNGQ